MLNKSIKFLIENKLVAVILLALFVGWGIVNAPFNWETGILPTDPVAVDAIPDIGENQQIVFTKWQGASVVQKLGPTLEQQQQQRHKRRQRHPRRSILSS